MGDELSSEPPARAGTSLLSALLAGGGAAAMAWAAEAVHDSTRTAHGEDAVIGWVLTGIAALGTVLCLYLFMIWTLAALIVLADPASRLGSALLAALRLLAPRLARRVAVSAAVAGAATGLVLTPVLAAQSGDSGAGPSPASTASTLQLHSTAPPPPSLSAELVGAPLSGSGSAPDADGGPAAGSEGGLPAIGWGGEPAPADTESPAVPLPAGSPDAPPRTVVVRSGDSLWSITDDLLGPAAEDPAVIASAWPLLHDTNRDVIGEDPDLLVPGQELVVPTALTSQEKS